MKRFLCSLIFLLALSAAIVHTQNYAFGTITAATPSPGDNTTNVATTAFVATSFAPLASPALTGTPTAPTAGLGTSSTQIATTAFVANGAGSSNVPRPNTRRWAYLAADGSAPGTVNGATSIGVADKIFVSASGGSATATAGTTTLPLRIVFVSPTATNGFARVSPVQQVLTSGRNLRMQAYVRLEGYTNPTRLWIGMFDTVPTGSNSPAAANYYAFRATQGTDTTYQCITATAGTQTITNSAITVDTNFHKFEIIVNDSIPNATFYIDNSSVCTNSAHIPASALLMFWMVSDDIPSGTTPVTWDYAWVYHEEDF